MKIWKNKKISHVKVHLNFDEEMHLEFLMGLFLESEFKKYWAWRQSFSFSDGAIQTELIRYKQVLDCCPFQ